MRVFLRHLACGCLALSLALCSFPMAALAQEQTAPLDGPQRVFQDELLGITLSR
jgi:hypothetical protein